MEERIRSREQPVSLVELFYDLIYVYAISRVTGIFDSAEVTVPQFTHYFVATFVVMQAWMYMTNYINRFGRARVYENVALAVNMCAAVVMSNTVAMHWGDSLTSLNWSLFAMLGTVAALYALRLREGFARREMARYSLKTLIPACLVYLLVALCSPVLDPTVGIVLDVVAILWGIWGPALIDPGYHLDLSLISFPHLVERFELITIITFGEAIVTVAHVFELAGFGAPAVMTFLSVVGMFGCYVVMMHVHADHRWQHRGLRLIYCHFIIVMSINLFTVCLNLLADDPTPRLSVCAVAAIALPAFYACLSLLEHYHRDEVSFSRVDRIVCQGAVLAGVALMFASMWTDIAVFVAGSLVMAAVCLWVFYVKGRACQEGEEPEMTCASWKVHPRDGSHR